MMVYTQHETQIPSSGNLQHMIFEDTSQKRWKISVTAFIALAVAGFALLATLVATIIVNPPLPSAVERESHQLQAIQVTNTIEKTTPPVKTPPTPTTARRRRTTIGTNQSATSTTDNLLATFRHNGELLTSAFLVQDDPSSVASFKAHAAQIDLVIPDWYTLTSAQCDVTEEINPSISTMFASSTANIMPRVSNGDAAGWHTTEMQQVLQNETIRTCIIKKLAANANEHHVVGLNVDIEGLDPEDKDNYLDFLTDLATALHAQHQLLTVDVASRDASYDLTEIGKIADSVFLMAYDEHYAGGTAGPIASEDWFSDTIDEALSEIPSQKLIIAMGAYGYDWTMNSTSTAQSLKFSEAMSLAKDVYAEPQLDQASRNMAFAYRDNNVDHQVWFLNGITAWNESLILKKKNVLGLSMWRLGTEDPQFWTAIAPKATPQNLTTVPALTSVEYATEGELLHIHTAPQDGAIDLTTDDDGSIDYADYTAVPTGYNVERAGAEIPAKTLALTFDDGPDETWTPQILSILEKEKVPAAFFVVGDQAQRFPDLLQRMAKDNFLVGDHTYLHPNLELVSTERTRIEVNATQRIIESAYGRKTTLFRAPYDTDSSPSTAEQLRPLQEVSSMGYTIAGANIDASDWEKPGVDQIVTSTVRQAQDPENHIIVMHDAGGDRSQTVAALPRIISELRAQGFTFVSLDQASGIPRDTLMPKLDQREWLFVEAANIWSFIHIWGWTMIVWLFYLTTGISILRIVFLGALVLKSERKRRKTVLAPLTQLVTVIIPAYNEEKVVAKTVEGVLRSSYTNIEILVVDDGSTDTTSAVVNGLIVQHPNVRLITKPNGGKSSALNLGFAEARGEIIVTIDGDTIVFPDTVSNLVAPLADASVDAVCGNVEVGNIHNPLTAFQALEYITTQNFDRRAFDELNCISVVPGATGAWRRKRVIDIGGYADDTLTEDADITLRLLRSGGKIVYAPEARSQTEAPETTSALAKQRFRWSYGTFQCLAKHKDAFFHGPLGWVALPNMFLFQILFPLLSPIGDAVFILSIFRGDFGAILSGYLVFLFMDVCGSLLAFTLERKPKKLMWLILIQRFYYRQFMYIITFRSILAILRGRRHGWNKLKRTGSVTSTG